MVSHEKRQIYFENQYFQYSTHFQDCLGFVSGWIFENIHFQRRYDVFSVTPELYFCYILDYRMTKISWAQKVLDRLLFTHRYKFKVKEIILNYFKYWKKFYTHAILLILFMHSVYIYTLYNCLLGVLCLRSMPLHDIIIHTNPS